MAGRIQIRPKGAPDAPAYSPQRDLAFIYPAAIREAFWSLDAAQWQEYFSGWLEQSDVDEDALGRGVQLFGDALKLFTNNADINEPADAFQRVGFLDLPSPVRIMIYERIGEVMTGGFFVAIRDTAMQGQLPPQHREMCEFIAAGRMISERIRGAVTGRASDDQIDVEALKIEVQELREQALSNAHAANLARRDAEIQRQLVVVKAGMVEIRDRTIITLTDDMETMRRYTLWEHIQAWWREFRRKKDRCGEENKSKR